MNRHKRRIIQHLGRSNAHRWVACFAASRLNRDEVAPFAQELGLSTQTVRNWRAAGRAYKKLRPLEPKLAEWAKSLGYSHFGTIGHLLRTKPDDYGERRGAVEDLRVAYNERVNIRDFNDEVKYEGDENAWQRAAERLYRLAVKVKDFYGAPKRLQDMAETFVEAFEEWRERNPA